MVWQFGGGGWRLPARFFAFIYNVKVKYSILNDDLYNFNETGFIIGIIITIIVVTTLDSRSSRAKQAQPSN